MMFSLTAHAPVPEPPEDLPASCRTHSARACLGWLVALLLAAMAVPGSGCASPEDSEVVIYVAVDRGNAEPILRHFEEQTGIRVRAVYDAEAAKTTGLVSRLIAESERPRCDVFWNNEVVQTLLLKREGLLERYEPATAGDVPAAYRDPDGYWTGVGSRCRVLVYNRRHLASSDVPRSILDLTDPRWRGRVAVADPQFGTTRTHVAALFAVLGRPRAEQYLRALRDNEVHITGGNAMVKNLVARSDGAEGSVVLGLTDTDDVRSGQADGDPIAMVLPDQEGWGTLRIPTTVCLVRGTPHRKAAEQLIDYLVSQEVEKRLTAAQSGYAPLRAGLGDDQAADLIPRRSLDVSHAELLDHLEISSRWTAEHFHP